MPINIKAKFITLTRLDGRRDECAQPYETRYQQDPQDDAPDVGAYQQADAWLRKAAATAPMLGSYHDVHFAVMFEDGEVYEGDLHLDHPVAKDGYDIGKHIREFCRAAVGEAKPPRMSQDAYDAKVNSIPIARRMYYRAILDYYDLNQKLEQVPVFNIPVKPGSLQQ